MASSTHGFAVLPALNEGATIRHLVERTLTQLRHVIVVDDGSSDDTSAQLVDLPVTVIRHEENQGKAASIWDGVQAALRQGAELIVTLDGDGQHAPEDIQRLLAAYRASPGHIIIGARLQNREAAPAARRFANDFADFWISWAAGHRIRDSQSGFRLYPATLLEHIKVAHDKAHGFVFESEILIEAARAGFGCSFVPIQTRYPKQARQSYFRPVTDVVAIILMVARKLLLQRMNLPGLYRVLSSRG
jgi:glycosyltransferase involved in cell wall biosynthesis